MSNEERKRWEREASELGVLCKYCLSCDAGDLLMWKVGEYDEDGWV